MILRIEASIGPGPRKERPRRRPACGCPCPTAWCRLRDGGRRGASCGAASVHRRRRSRRGTRRSFWQGGADYHRALPGQHAVRATVLHAVGTPAAGWGARRLLGAAPNHRSWGAARVASGAVSLAFSGPATITCLRNPQGRIADRIARLRGSRWISAILGRAEYVSDRSPGCAATKSMASNTQVGQPSNLSSSPGKPPRRQLLRGCGVAPRM